MQKIISEALKQDIKETLNFIKLFLFSGRRTSCHFKYVCIFCIKCNNLRFLIIFIYKKEE